MQQSSIVSFVFCTLLASCSLTYGLQCYQCISGDGLESDNEYHSACGNEQFSESSFLVTCPADTGYACSSANTTFNDSVTVIQRIAKRCISDSSSRTEEWCQDIATNTTSGNVCLCYEDGCNGNTGTIANDVNTISAPIILVLFMQVIGKLF